jgi:L-amino acid N-acyltransferase YncA
MMQWLRAHGVAVVIAHIHPDHHASLAVAKAVGLASTATMVDGEERWQDSGR